MKQEDKIIIICSEIHYTGAPATQEICEDCNKLIWLSKSSVDTIIEKHPEIVGNRTGRAAIMAVMEKSKLVCIECGLPQLKGADKSEVLGLGKKQINEIMQWILKQRSARDN